MEAAQAQGENTHPQKRVQHKDREQLELAASIGGVSRDSQQLQEPARQTLDERHVRQPEPIRVLNVLHHELGESKITRP